MQTPNNRKRQTGISPSKWQLQAQNIAWKSLFTTHCITNDLNSELERFSRSFVCVWYFRPLLLIVLPNVKHLWAAIFPKSVFPYSSACCSDLSPTSWSHYPIQEGKEGAKGHGLKVCFCPIHFDSVWRPKLSFIEARPSSAIHHSYTEIWVAIIRLGID